MPNNSPWIHPLDKARKTQELREDAEADVAVIGAGIAGISTAFFLMEHTDRSVIILERDKLAHGATGHNAGYVVAELERSFHDIVREFGLEQAARGVRDIEETWFLLDDVYSRAGLTTPFYRTVGHKGLSTLNQILDQLEDSCLRKKANLRTDKVLISEEAEFLRQIPAKYEGLYFVVPAQEIILQLETLDTQYSAVVLSPAGVMNSALFCEEVLGYLLEKYPDRLSLYEHTAVAKVVLHEDGVLLDALKNTVKCQKVVLCTNGFENIEIISPAGLSINTRYHHQVNGVIAFMSGFLEKPVDSPSTFYYYQKENGGLTDNPGDPYFYVSRRPYEYEENVRHNLVCIGGPDHALEDRAVYDRHEEYPSEAYKTIDRFVRGNYDKWNDLEYAFHWHGVMGYTTNLLRMVGRDPEHGQLFYNLGCNGIGVIPSIFGGDRVARIIAGEEFPPSIFDAPRRVEDAKEAEKATKPEAEVLLQ